MNVMHSQAFKDEEEAEVVSATLSTDKFAVRREITGKPLLGDRRWGHRGNSFVEMGVVSGKAQIEKTVIYFYTLPHLFIRSD